MPFSHGLLKSQKQTLSNRLKSESLTPAGSLKKRNGRICAVIFPKCPERFDIKGEERKFSSTEDRQNEVIRTVFPLRYRKSF